MQTQPTQWKKLKGQFLLLNVFVAVLLGAPLLAIFYNNQIHPAVLLAIFLAQVMTISLLFKRFGDNFSKRIRKINNSLTALAAGKLPEKVTLAATDELAITAVSINNLIDRIESAASFAKKIGQGELNAHYDEQFKDDVLAKSLQLMHAQLKVTDHENQKRNWINQGLATFGDIIRSTQSDFRVLSTKVISTLVKYLNANQGQLYVVKDDEEDRCLELYATYAWEKNKILSKRINEGEGLVGQAWLEGSSMFLKEVPKDYIRITSGLGQALPKYLLITPMKINEDIFGIIEIASFNDLEQHQIEFVEKVGELIASTLSTVRINERTQRLLEESQTQTEQMRAQEEEMRQSMEELTATQEELYRKEMESSSQLAAIDHSMSTIEFTTEGQVITANERFLQTMGYSLNEVRGKHHRMFVDSTYADSDEYKKFWRALAQGISQTGEFRRIHKTGKPIWISASYTVTMDQNGRPEKVIKFAMDITQQKLKSLEFEGQIMAVNNAMASAEFNLDGTILGANAKFLKAMGYDAAEIIGKNHSLFTDAETASSPEYKQFWADLKHGKPKSGEFKRIGSNEKEVWVNASYTPVKDFLGRVHKVLLFAHDITEEKNKAIDFEGQISAIRRSNAVIEFDMDGKILSANERFLEALGYVHEFEVVGRHHRLFVHEADAKSEDYAKFWERLTRGEHFTGEFRRKKRDGSTLWIFGSYNPILNAQGEPYKVVKYAQVVAGKDADYIASQKAASMKS